MSWKNFKRTIICYTDLNFVLHLLIHTYTYIHSFIYLWHTFNIRVWENVHQCAVYFFVFICALITSVIITCAIFKMSCIGESGVV